MRNRVNTFLLAIAVFLIFENSYTLEEYVNGAQKYMSDWKEFIMSFSNKKDKVSELNNRLKRSWIPISSYLKSELESNEPYIEWPNPCGSSLTIFKNKISEDSIFGFDEVKEIDRSGKVINTWNIPLESRILGLSNDNLIIRYNIFAWYSNEKNEFELHISKSGEMKFDDLKDSYSDPIYDSTYSDDNQPYLKRLYYKDERSNIRLLQFHGPCT